MINQREVVAYLRVNSLEQVYSIPAGSEVLMDYLNRTPKNYKKIKYNQLIKDK